MVVLLLAALSGQVAWEWNRPPDQSTAEALPSPPPLALLQVTAAGDDVVLGRLLMLWLQAFDNQSGISVPFSRLDYHVVVQWLGRVLALDPRGQYPLLSAARVYAGVPSPDQKITMFEFVYRNFLDDPNRRWPWLASAAIGAKHQLHDLPRALRYARALTEYATGPGVPAWARDMTLVISEEMGEYESALYLAHHLLESGRVTDPNEIRYLAEKLESLAEKIRLQP